MNGAWLGKYHSLYERLMSRTVKTDTCWLFGGAKRPNFGYGIIMANGKRGVRAHRVSWEIANGRQVPAGKVVRHLCHNPACIRPDHLAVGDQADNVADRVRAGRSRPRGPARRTQSRPATTTERAAILKRYSELPRVNGKVKTGELTRLAAEFGRSDKSVLKIAREAKER